MSGYVVFRHLTRQRTSQNKIEKLWNPALLAWFPEGMTDPSIVLLKVHVEEAEYWDSPSSAVVQVLGFAKAVLTGKHMDQEASAGVHRSVHFS